MKQTFTDHLYEAALFMLNPKPDAQRTIDLVDGAGGSMAGEISSDPGKDPAEDPGNEARAAGPRDYSIELEEFRSAVAISLALPMDVVGAEIDGAGKLHITAMFASLKGTQKALGLKKQASWRYTWPADRRVFFQSRPTLTSDQPP